ncbi:type 2 isopentenyl-diphosphate Delta-isomerase [Alicyclobacillus fastidiosus]|uniref:Isopentenyl-diphosphate delta-isomerase n=1 Tax=Alicyclobacillus fastidiosus TaxID=392011 RepID=A0ABV5ALM8_9BACL|nr:type 2 isopentenyl-diphosphate Delta-isomerase [Alicyclobacillus fastidiosus]WEH10597.1 type 2 isopentenyl-diphosphate Delta-isomerase [Alicyclobacillus fastidiosus]
MDNSNQIEQRKNDHIQINLDYDVSGKGITSGLEQYRFNHDALPNVNLEDIDTNVEFLERRLQLPLIISSMTGGTSQGEHINRNLATAAQHFHIALALGSGRAAISNPSTAKSFYVRKEAPNVLLFANLGAIQLNYGYTAKQCAQLVELMEADGLILHLNPLQEAVQPEGNTHFERLIDRISDVCATLSVPVMVKEVGWGLSAEVIQSLYQAGVVAVDVAGAGGTSWSEVERHRGTPDQAAIASAFSNWGIPTADAIIRARSSVPTIPIVASGGIRSGVDAAKCLALGSTIVGMASPFLKAAVESSQEVEKVIRVFEQQLRITMFCTGNSNIECLRKERLTLMS